jgi:SMC interacting uncharacterized protein involved in chromosome segregation
MAKEKEAECDRLRDALDEARAKLRLAQQEAEKLEADLAKAKEQRVPSEYEAGLIERLERENAEQRETIKDLTEQKTKLVEAIRQMRMEMESGEHARDSREELLESMQGQIDSLRELIIAKKAKSKRRVEEGDVDEEIEIDERSDSGMESERPVASELKEAARDTSLPATLHSAGSTTESKKLHQAVQQLRALMVEREQLV